MKKFIKTVRNRIKWHIVSDYKVHLETFRKTFGYIPDICNPQTLTEYILWRKLYDKDPRFTLYSDKYRVRELLDDSLLIPLIGAYDKPEEIDYDTLPNQFIIKVNHGSGQNIIVYDKDNLDIKETNRILHYWMKNSHYYRTREWQYKDISPKIVIEKLLLTSEGIIPDDFKFNCIGGKVVYIYCAFNTQDGNTTAGIYDRNFKSTELESREIKVPIVKNPKKPKNFNHMIQIAESLSKPFDYVRIDLYNVNGKIYFGEYTFTTANGKFLLYPRKYDFEFGAMVQSVRQKNIQ